MERARRRRVAIVGAETPIACITVSAMSTVLDRLALQGLFIIIKRIVFIFENYL